MEKEEYLEIKKQLSFEKPVILTLVTMAVQLSLLALAIALLLQGTALTYLLSQLLFALYFFHAFAMLHEAGHGNLHKKRLVNWVVGHFFSVFCFIPFFSWQHMHQGHHVYAGSINKDPGSRTLRKIRQLGKVPKLYQIGWKLWVPMPAIAQHVMLWFYPLRIWREEPENKRTLYQSFFSVCFLVLAYLLLFQLFPEVVTAQNFLPAILLYFVLTEIINAPHHVGMPHFYSTPEKDRLRLWEQNLPTRSCHYYGVLSEIVTLNFSLHTEHHFFPTLPWYRLKKARDLIKPRLGKSYNEVGDFSWNWRTRKVAAGKVVLSDDALLG
ncbi:MAG: fatty acid desaturase [Alphaproteobacteria bacterium]|nr:fatty acid desaturase [Alphaproteobacteria bacterium]